ncbi:MAG: GntR family transcriptional regulator [Hyphomicrobiaceae bacterium]|nr:GntR family transcriptional regulator [Hyphomicrobiaceae bacterium]
MTVETRIKQRKGVGGGRSKLATLPRADAHPRGPLSPHSDLEDDIVEGRLRPGARLDEATLAARFGVSRTPIREALRSLAAAGLVEIRPHRGAVVSAPDPRTMIEMFLVMAELEAICARLAARRLTAGDERALKETLAACERASRAGDTDAYYFENAHFHQLLYAASGNRFLADQALALHKRLAPFRRLQLRVRNRMHVSQAEHAAIVAAIVAGAEDAAAEAARAHVFIQGERFNDLLASLEDAEPTVPMQATRGKLRS